MRDAVNAAAQAPQPMRRAADRSVLAENGPAVDGRRVVTALFLSGFMLFGGGLYSFILLVPVLTQEFHWSRAVTGGLVSAFWLAAPVALLGGVLIRRLGARNVLALGVTLEALGLLAFASASTLPVMYLLRALMGLGKVLYAVTIPVLVARWFKLRFALGCAIAWAGWHAGGLGLAPLAGLTIAHWGWRMTCVLLAAAMLVVGLVPALLLIPRDRRPDAQPATEPSASGDLGIYRLLFTSGYFWAIASGTVCCWFVYAGMLAHQSALVEEAGVTSGWASLALGSTAAFAALGTLGMGVLAERWRLKNVGLLEHGLLTAGVIAILLFTVTGAPAALLLHVVAFGAAIGGCDVFWTTLLKERIGEARLSYGYGIWYFFVVTTLLVGPIISGHFHDLTGDYRAAGLLLATAAVAAGVIGFLATPRKNEPLP